MIIKLSVLQRFSGMECMPTMKLGFSLCDWRPVRTTAEPPHAVLDIAFDADLGEVLALPTARRNTSAGCTLGQNTDAALVPRSCTVLPGHVSTLSTPRYACSAARK